MLEEWVLAARQSALPDDHHELLVIRFSLASSMATMGDLAAARELEELVVATYERTLPPDHINLLKSRMNLASTMRQMGDLPEARQLHESVVAGYERTRPEGDPDLLAARLNLARSMSEMGELENARDLQESVVAGFEQTLPQDHPSLVTARVHLSITLREMGDLEGARELQEAVLEARQRSLPAGHPLIVEVQSNLAVTMRDLGDLPRARGLQESVLAVLEKTLQEDHPALLRARLNLASITSAMGHLLAARGLFESVLPVYEQILPEDHPALLAARVNLAITLSAMGEFAGARELMESVLRVQEKALPEGHPVRLNLQMNLALAMNEMGDLADARDLLESVVEIREQTLPEDHPDLLQTKINLARTMSRLGEMENARELLDLTLDDLEWVLPKGHPDLLSARWNLAVVLSSTGKHAQAAECTRALLEGSLVNLRLDAAVSRVQAETQAVAQRNLLDWCLSYTAVNPDAVELRRLFQWTELNRSRGAVRERVLRQLVVPGDLNRELEELHREILDLSARARRALNRSGRSDDPETEEDERWAELNRLKQRVEAERLEKLDAIARSQNVEIDASADGIAATLPEGTAAVAFWGYRRGHIGAQPGELGPSRESLVAFVMRKGDPLQRIELGSSAIIRNTLSRWFDSMGVTRFRGPAPDSALPSRGEATLQSLGERLRSLVFDPLREALGDCRHIVMALDGALHLVPFGALPGSPSHGEFGLLSDRFDFEVRTSLKERTVGVRPVLHEPSLLVLGGIQYDEKPEAPGIEDGTSEIPRARSSRTSGRSTHSTLAFDFLKGTQDELQDVDGLFEQRFGEAAEARTLTGSAATRETFLARASSARFVHLATHAYVEDETIPCILDVQPEDANLRQFFSDRRTQVRGLSPMSIAGVAFAGANREDPEIGGSLGVVTAAEIADLDLSGCELIVFSACGSSVGIERAGQGLASLQQAAFIAGARMTLTSLYKVPDVATHELMKRFYDNWWLEGAKPREALRMAQRHMRDQQSPEGIPIWRTLDWAGWVLAGSEE